MTLRTRIITLMTTTAIALVAATPVFAFAESLDASIVGDSPRAIASAVDGDETLDDFVAVTSEADEALADAADSLRVADAADAADEAADATATANAQTSKDVQVADAAPTPVDDTAIVKDDNSASANDNDAKPASTDVTAPADTSDSNANDSDIKLANASDATPADTSESAVLRSSGLRGPSESVSYRAHVQNIGWQDWASDGEIAGTSGQALRMEAVEISLNGSYDGEIFCQAHVENIGWQHLQGVGEGEGVAMVGTSGQALRVEAFKFTLAGDVSCYYDIVYRAHVENIGWQDWVENGDIAGTSGQALRVEALQIKLVKKSTPTSESDGGPGLVYTAHVENIGWQDQKASGEMAGTSGQALRVEAVQIWLDKAAASGTIAYRAHVAEIGWQDWVYSGEVAGTTGQALRVEALQIKLVGDIADHYDIVYRTHVQNVGWQPWTLNGVTAGTSGQALRVEALKITLIPKGTFEVSEGAYLLSRANTVNNLASSNNGGTMTVSSDCVGQAQKFYIRKESGGAYSIQSVETGKFLTDDGGTISQKAYSSGSAAQLWTITWNGGAIIKNQSTGKALSISKSAVSTETFSSSSANQHLGISDVQLIANGTYIIKTADKGLALDVSNASWRDGANVMVYTSNGGGNQAFVLTQQNNGAYLITCAMTNKGLDVVCGSSENGTNVHQWHQGPEFAQQWNAYLDRDGSIEFVNTKSGRHLSTTGSGNAGANVVSSDATGSNNRKWRLEATTYTPDWVLMRALELAQYEWSDTDYLILVDLTYNRTIVFEGSYGNWDPIFNWVCSTGAHDGHETVLGYFSVTGKGESFDGALGGEPYTCYYYTQFYGDFLFHSVPYYQGTWIVQDDTLGYAVSHGCVRLATENAKWLYDYIPYGTLVYTYY